MFLHLAILFLGSAIAKPTPVGLYRRSPLDFDLSFGVDGDNNIATTAKVDDTTVHVGART